MTRAMNGPTNRRRIREVSAAANVFRAIPSRSSGTMQQLALTAQIGAVPRSSLLVARCSFLIPRSSFLVPRSSFLAPRSSLDRYIVYVRRPLTVLFALWFAAVLGDPGMLHTCAMHGAGHGGHGAHAAMSHDAHSDMAGMDHGQHSAAPESHHEAPAPATCTCVGHCCAATIAAPVGPGPTITIAALTPAPRLPSAVREHGAPAAPDQLLPFANGPPAV